MTRCLMVLVTLAATAAEAQQATKAAKQTQSAVPLKGKPPASSVAARSIPESRLGASAQGESTLDLSTDCSLVQAFRRGGRAPVIRTYAAPSPEQTGTGTKKPERTSYVSAVARCGQLYIFQVWSESKNAWAAKLARLEAPSGDLLHVNDLFFDWGQDGYGITTIVAAAPPGKRFTKLTVTLTSEDGRAVLLEARDLP